MDGLQSQHWGRGVLDTVVSVIVEDKTSNNTSIHVYHLYHMCKLWWCTINLNNHTILFSTVV
jgi:hypothetical protein